MPDIVFADLVEIYRNTRFGDANEGTLTVASERIAAILRAVEADTALYERVQITALAAEAPTVGADLGISIGPPSPALGLLLRDFDALFLAPGAAFHEPTSYYIIQDCYASGDEPPPPVLEQYRSLLNVVAILRDAAAYVDEGRREFVFIGVEKVVVPIRFRAIDLSDAVVNQAERLRHLFEDPLHRAEKVALISTIVVELVGSQQPASRFAYLIHNIERICDEVEKGYRLFASSFSYSKIRNDVEAARIDFVGKIHKTIVDIQGQLLGIPVATIVVASQLKQVPDCGMPFWTNAAVLLGAWIFVFLLGIAVINQWHTLSVLGGEIKRQQRRLADDYAAVSDQFKDQFDDLIGRVWWHRVALAIVGFVASMGAIVTTWAFIILTDKKPLGCLSFWQ